MKFAEIIRNAGLEEKEFPNCSKIRINLYDGKDRIRNEESITFVEPLLKNNEGSFKNFKHFLSGLETEIIESMDVKVDIAAIIMFYKTPRAMVFMRNPSMDPLDYME